ALLAVTTFVQCGGWINPARVDPAYVRTVCNDRGVSSISPTSRTSVPAICLSVGVVQQCSIVCPAVTNLNNGQERTTREVLVKGFSQEEQRKLAFFASVFGFNCATIAASAGVITYSSMQCFDKVPIKEFKRLHRRDRPARYAPGSRRLQIYPQFRLPSMFNLQIPIYDGRRSSDTAFECDPNQLHEIAINSYPLYNNGDVDLPPGSLVTVAVSRCSQVLRFQFHSFFIAGNVGTFSYAYFYFTLSFQTQH
ncbi:hypothetical protein F5880DRAFT_1512123, partial [Lentinula raphanica]